MASLIEHLDNKFNSDNARLTLDGFHHTKNFSIKNYDLFRKSKPNKMINYNFE